MTMSAKMALFCFVLLMCVFVLAVCDAVSDEHATVEQMWTGVGYAIVQSTFATKAFDDAARKRKARRC